MTPNLSRRSGAAAVLIGAVALVVMWFAGLDYVLPALTFGAATVAAALISNRSSRGSALFSCACVLLSSVSAVGLGRIVINSRLPQSSSIFVVSLCATVYLAAIGSLLMLALHAKRAWVRRIHHLAVGLTSAVLFSLLVLLVFAIHFAGD